MRDLGGYLGITVVTLDFKISGVIGNSGKKNRMNVVSLTHQLNDCRTPGYSNNEFLGGVLKVISPTLRLGNVLETMRGLTIET